MISRRNNARHNRGRIPGRSGGGTSPPYSPLNESGCVFFFEADHASVSTTSASISDASDFTTANWTKTGVTVTPDSDGTYDLLTSTAATATTAQAPANASTTQPITFTVDVKRVASNFVYIQTGAIAASRTWFNISAGTVGTTGANHSGISIVANGSGGWTITLTASIHTDFTLAHADADNTLTNTIGHSFLARSVTVAQTRATAFNNIASAVNWSEVAANRQPRFVANSFGSLPGLVFNGAQSFISTEAAVLGALNGDDPAFTFVSVQRIPSVAAVFTSVLGTGDTVSTVNNVFFGQTNGSLQTYVRVDGAGVVGVWDPLAISTATQALFIRSSNGQQVFFSRDGGAEVSETIATVGSVAATRVALGQRPLATPDIGFTGSMGMVLLYNANKDPAALARILNYCRTKWGTP